MCRVSDDPLKSKGLLSTLKGAFSIITEFNKATNTVQQKAVEPSQSKPVTKAADVPAPRKPVAKGQTFSFSEVAKHNKEEDCWVVVKGKVYDVSGWVPSHPGGPVILTYAGKDATDVFSTFHAATTWPLLKDFCIGDLKEDGPSDAMLQDFRNLRQSMLQQGLFKSNKLYYVFKVFSNYLLLGVAVALLAYAGNSSWTGLLGSAGILGLFWQQSGWLAHDFLHHQVFTNRTLNNMMGYVLGNLSQGFSVDWWKKKHNTHHAAPNEITIDSHPVDPDIDTLPLIAWDKDMLDSVQDPNFRALLRLQHFFFFPILLFARMSWAEQSFSHSVRLYKTGSPDGLIEVATVGLHYTWFLGMAFAFLPWWKALVYAVAAQMLSGFFLSIVFVQSHNGMEVYSDTKDFVTAQVVSTRNISSSLWNDWFTGGLNYQLEHHLFPSLPRHNLGKVKPLIQELCKKHDMTYELCSMTEGTRRVLKRLADVAASA